MVRTDGTVHRRPHAVCGYASADDATRASGQESGRRQGTRVPSTHRFFAPRFRAPVAGARFFEPRADACRVAVFRVPRLDVFFRPAPADFFFAAARDFFADRVVFPVARVVDPDAAPFFAAVAVRRERAGAVRRRAVSPPRDVGSSRFSTAASSLAPPSSGSFTVDAALGNVARPVGKLPAGSACCISNRSRTRLCASFCLFCAWRMSSPCRSRPATL